MKIWSADSMEIQSILICITTTDSLERAKHITQTLLNEKLAACISVSEVKSSYWWKGKIENSKEFLLIIKSFPELKEKLEKRIKEIHNYSVPEIIFFEGHASKPYLDWLFHSLSK